MSEDWIKLLRVHVGNKSSAQVARELGVSGSLISQVLKGTYKASPEKLAQRVMAIYGHGDGVPCPVQGRIEPLDCAETHSRALRVGLNVGNPSTFRQHRACLHTCIIRKDSGQ